MRLSVCKSLQACILTYAPVENVMKVKTHFHVFAVEQDRLMKIVIEIGKLIYVLCQETKR